jgi:hypothetical protein
MSVRIFPKTVSLQIAVCLPDIMQAIYGENNYRGNHEKMKQS